MAKNNYNIKPDYSKMRKAELISVLDKQKITELYLEERFFELIGGTWNGCHHNSWDGTTASGQKLEIKSQIYKIHSGSENGPYQLRGRGKFGCISEQICLEKLKNKERVVHIGADSSGTTYYIMSYMFFAIADEYMKAVEIIKTKNYDNFDVLPNKFKDHHSFQMHFIHPEIRDLEYDENGNQIFAKKFYEELCDYPPEEIIVMEKAFK